MLLRAKQAYWQLSRDANMWKHAVSGKDREFRSVVLEDYLRRAKPFVKPVGGETVERATAAAQWLSRAQDATPDDGASYGYFPVSGARGWEVSYPETTGYIITSFVDYALITGRQEFFERARRMAVWEAEVQMSNGAVQGGKLTTPDKQTAATFNTGMVLDGFVSVLENSSHDTIESAAQIAADFLVCDLTDEGLFQTNGEFVSKHTVKLFNVLCAWALYRFGNLSGASKYRSAATLAVEGALSFMSPNGWLNHNCLDDPLHPLTHTIGYSLQGILEVGLLSGRDEFIAATRTGFDPILKHIQPNGFLSGRFDSKWRAAANWSCLTGSAQLAIVGYRLGTISGEKKYFEAAEKLINFLKAVQRVNTGNPAIDGALSGSFPILGSYMKGGYPNWATKYLLDALMLQMKQQ